MVWLVILLHAIALLLNVPPGFDSSPVFSSVNTTSIFNVIDFGATSKDNDDDVEIDSSEAFLRAWNASCTATATLADDHHNPTILVPQEGKFLVYPVTFNGPCKAKNIDLVILGEILAPVSPSTWKSYNQGQWIVFRNVTGLSIYGEGVINGRGSGWWNQSCRYHPQLTNCTKLAPTAMKFLSCYNTSIRDIHLIDSAQTHVAISRGTDSFWINNVSIKAPGNSPNTDGIHLQRATHVFIANSWIESGDDCVSIGDYTSNVNIFNVVCGPGHGISIGSLGKGGNFVQVENIHVKGIHFNQTTNGARIKTWQVGRGYVRKVNFEDLSFHSVKNPIIIDQNYCNVRGACQKQETGVQISGVTYSRLFGTSKTKAAISLNCSESVPCQRIALNSVVLRAIEGAEQVVSSCVNAHGVALGVIYPPSCLQEGDSFHTRGIIR